MSVYIDGQEYEEYSLEEQANDILDEFYISESVLDSVKHYMPSDISYFDDSKIEQLFRDLNNKEEPATPEEYAYILCCIILNIGTACRIPYSLEQAYTNNKRYTGSILRYFNKYKNQLAQPGRNKLKNTIEKQFKHFEINPIKSALSLIKIKGVPLAKMPLIIFNISPKTVPGKIVNSLTNMFTGWLAIRYYDLLEALRMYKRAVDGKYDINDPQSVIIEQKMKKEAEYFYDITYRVLNDMLKVYDQL